MLGAPGRAVKCDTHAFPGFLGGVLVETVVVDLLCEHR